jgi:AcrR family transcriptional regulator
VTQRHQRQRRDRQSIQKLLAVSPEPQPLDRGLRERKKRELRQRISNTATGMFMELGFDQVRVIDIAEACGVSEKTVFNYFSTKESLVFDKEDETAARIREAIRDRGPDISLIDAILRVMEDDLDEVFAQRKEAGSVEAAIDVFRDFGEMVENTPALATWSNGMMERLAGVAAEALAERAGVDPEDPEPQLAGLLVLGLWKAQFQAMRRHSHGSLTPEQVQVAVKEDVRRAARVADSGLSAFNLALHPGKGHQQLLQSARKTDDVRRELIRVMKESRKEWRQVLMELRSQARLHDMTPMDRGRIQVEIRIRQRVFRAQQRDLATKLRQGRQKNGN